MDFMTAAKTGFNRLTDFDGKSGRAEFWWYVLAVVIVTIVLTFILATVLGQIGGFVASLVSIGLLIAATVRRLRDAGKPEVLAYVYFGLSLLTNASYFLGFSLGMLTSILGLVTLVVALVLLFFLVQPSAGGAAAE